MNTLTQSQPALDFKLLRGLVHLRCCRKNGLVLFGQQVPAATEALACCFSSCTCCLTADCRLNTDIKQQLCCAEPQLDPLDIWCLAGCFGKLHEEIRESQTCCLLLFRPGLFKVQTNHFAVFCNSMICF